MKKRISHIWKVFEVALGVSIFVSIPLYVLCYYTNTEHIAVEGLPTYGTITNIEQKENSVCVKYSFMVDDKEYSSEEKLTKYMDRAKVGQNYLTYYKQTKRKMLSVLLINVPVAIDSSRNLVTKFSASSADGPAPNVDSLINVD